MDKRLENLIKEITSDVRDIKYVDAEHVPDIGLYMDQVTGFLNEKLADTKRCEDDKIMTKTMINNYAKNGLIPPPVKKKYTKEQLMILIFLYYYKNFLTISDIDRFMSPLIEEYYRNADATLEFGDIFSQIFSSCDAARPVFDKSVEHALEMAKETFKNVPEDEQDNLQLFSFISILGQDIYAKLMIMQRLIDTLPASDDRAGSKEKNKKTTD